MPSSDAKRLKELLAGLNLYHNDIVIPYDDDVRPEVVGGPGATEPPLAPLAVNQWQLGAPVAPEALAPRISVNPREQMLQQLRGEYVPPPPTEPHIRARTMTEAINDFGRDVGHAVGEFPLIKLTNSLGLTAIGDERPYVDPTAAYELKMGDPGAPVTLGTVAKRGGAKLAQAAEAAAASVREAVETAFPTLNKFNKRRGFLTPTQALATLEAAPIPDALKDRGRALLADRTTKIHPEEVAKMLLGETYDPGRVLTGVKQAVEGQRNVGAPTGVTPRIAAARRTGQIARVEEGMAGRPWYDDSGKMIMFHAGDDPALARKVADNLALISNDNTVGGNLTMSLKLHDQAMADVPMHGGKYPTRQSPLVQSIYEGNAFEKGLKKEPFSQQLALGGNFASVEEARAVNDIWMGEFFGFTNPDGTPKRSGFTPAQHRWMDEQTEKLITRMNAEKVGGFSDWNTGNLQAAAWTAAKIRAGKISAEDAAKSFATYMPQHYIQTGRDFLPGRTTGHLPNLKDIPAVERDDYLRRVAAIFHDPEGRDIASKMAGQLTGGSVHGPAIYEDIAIPGRQNLTAVGEDLTKGKGRFVTAPSQALVQSNEAGYGLLTGQDMVAGTYPNVEAPAATRNMLEFKLRDGPLRMESGVMRDPRLVTGITKGEIAVMPAQDGAVRLLWIGPDAPGERAAFQKLGKDLVKQHAAPGTKPGWSRNVGFAAFNDWGTPEGKVGQTYARMVSGQEVADAAGNLRAYPTPEHQERLSARLIENFNKARPDQARQLVALNEYASKQFGLPVSEVFLDLQRAIRDSGFEGIAAMAKKLGVPLAVMLTFADYVVSNPGEAAPRPVAAPAPNSGRE